MSNSTSCGSGNEQNEDSIKAAVREATKKTQERLAAYQNKPQAGLVLEDCSSKETAAAAAQGGEDTVSRLQALVGESRRLSAKSRDLHSAMAATAKEPTTPGAPALHRSMSCDPSSISTTPTGKKFSDMFPAPNTPSADNNMKGPPLKRSATVDSATSLRSSVTTPTHTPGGSLAKGKKLGALFKSLNGSLNNSNGSKSGFSASISKLASGSDETVSKLKPVMETKVSQASLNHIISPKRNHHQGIRRTSSNNNKPAIREDDDDEESGDGNSIDDIDIDIDEEDYDDDDESATDEPSGKQAATAKSDNDDDDDGAGEYSIFSLVDNGMKETAKSAGVQGLRPDEIQDLMEDYYTEPPTVPDVEALDSSLPLLEAILETPKPEKPKAKVGGSSAKKKKKTKTTDDIHERSSNSEKKAMKALGKSMSAIQEVSHHSDDEDEDDYTNNDDEEMDSSMPMLAPFETPKVEKPKLMQATAKSSALNGDITPPLPPPAMAMQEESLNLSQIMRQTDMLVPDNANARSRNNSNSGGDSGSNNNNHHGSGSHKSGLRRPSMEHDTAETAPAGADKSPQRSSAKSSNRSNRRKSNERERGEENDAISTKTGRSSKSAHSRKKPSSRRSSIGKSSDHKKNEEIASRAINKYHRTGGQGSSTMDGLNVCEITGEVKSSSNPELDISAISENSAENDKSLQDGSDSMGGSSHSSRSMSRSSRRGRSSVAEPGSRSRGISRSRSRRGVSRSVSRSASVRRNPSRRRSQGVEEDGGTGGGNKSSVATPRRQGRRNSIGGTKPDRDSNNNNSSLRGDRISMRDSSNRRSRISASARDSSLRDSSFRDGRRRQRSMSTRRHASRRNQRGGREEEQQSTIAENLEQSQHSTAEEILGSLDVSDIKIVGEDEAKKSRMAASESGRISIYDRTKPRNSLAGLSKLESTEEARPIEDDENSMTGSVQTKKSKMGRFARKMGRRLTMQKKKKKKGTNSTEDEDSDDNEDDEDDEDVDLDQLAADFDEEEKELYERSGSLHDSFARGDFTQAQALDDLMDDVGDGKKSKKKHRASVFGKIKKMGKMGKKKKKKDKKDRKGSEILESDSESSEDELLGSEYSGGTPERSQSESYDEDDIDPQSDDFVQLQIDGERASVVHGSDHGDDPVTITPTKAGRPRRQSTVAARRQRANQQRNMSLQAALESTANRNSLRGGGGDEGSVATTNTAAHMRNRRARSLRGKIQRKADDVPPPPGGKMTLDVKRAKSLKGRIEGEGGAAVAHLGKGTKRIRRARSVEFEKMNTTTNGEDGEAPAFDWTAYSVKKETAPSPKEAAAAQGRRGKGKRRSQADKRMSGGLSKVIYAGQTVTS